MAAYKDEQRGTWYVSFHYYDWMGKNCRKVKRGFKTKREATEWEHHFRMKEAADLDMTFGESKDDWGLAAEVDGKIVGAVWVRIMNDYGHIDDETPSLAISLYKEYRGFGIGTAMMKEILALLKSHGYSRVSLSVQKDNYAAKMYLKIGFEIVRENEEEYIMVYLL